MYSRLVSLILAGLACAALGCSPKVVAGDASAGVDAVDAGVVDSLGDLADGGGDGVADAIGDADADEPQDDSAEVDANADAITDATSDVAEVDADAAPLPLDCTAGAMPAQADGFVLTDVGPLVPNKVVTGCGKGKPEPVSKPTECGCDCPPPYSCYCNGECAWLRTPDLKVPSQDGKGVWTGKWVVTMTNFYLGQNEKNEMIYKVVVERWNPASSEGFLLSAHPKPDILPGNPRLFFVGGKVLVTTEGVGPPDGSGLNPQRPAYLFDPETDTYEPIQMPMCSELVATATHVACCDGGEGGEGSDKGAVHLYDVAAKSWSKVKAPPGLLPAGKSLCWQQYEDLVADEGNLYFINPVWSGSLATWPDGSISKDGGHILRYDVAAKAWKDVGAVPQALVEGEEFVFRSGEGILFGTNVGGLQVGFFDLATGKTTISTSKSAFVITGEVLALGCGALISTARFTGQVVPVGQQNKYNVPAFIRPDLSIEFFPNWGFPSDDRGSATVLKTDKDLLILGGNNGNYPHRDGYRYPLSQVCKGAKP